MAYPYDCKHSYIVVEAEGDTTSWRAHKLMCSKCLLITTYKSIIKINQEREVENINPTTYEYP